MSRWRPVLRQLAADPWGSVALALLVVLVSAVATIGPRSVASMSDRQLVVDVDGLSAAQRDVTAHVGTTAMPPEAGADPWAPLLDGLDRVRARQPEPLRSLLTSPEVVTEVTREHVFAPAVESGYYQATVTLRADPHLADKVEVVDGAMPEPQTGSGAPGVLVLDQTAREMHWKVGQVVDGLLIAGTYRPRDPADRYWQHVPDGTSMGVLVDPNRGEAGVATAFLSPRSAGSTNGQPAAVIHQMWFPVDPAGVPGDQVDVLRRQLTGMTAKTWPLTERSTEGRGAPAVSGAFRSDLTTTLDRVLVRQRATSAVLAVLASGPIGVTIAVLALGARLIVRRRSGALGLALARGASTAQLRTVTAVEGLALGLPAAVLGHLLGALLVRGHDSWVTWVLTLALGLAPALVLALSVDTAGLLTRRSDLGTGRSRWRPVAEAAVLVLAGLATWRLLTRGAGDGGSVLATGAAPADGADLLAAAAPALVALAACVLTLRLYPLPLAALTRVLHRRPGLTPFVGAARALRDPAGGLVPALAVVLGTTVALTSAVLLTTIARGTEVATWTTNGADIRVSGPRVDASMLARLRALEGVAAVGTVAEPTSSVEVVDGTTRRSVDVLVLDPALAQVWSDPALEGAVPVDELFSGATTVTGPALPGSGTLRTSTLGELRVVGTTPALPGVRPRGDVLAVSAATYRSHLGEPPPPTLALVSVRDGADPHAVAKAIDGVVGSARVEVATDRWDAQRGAPVAQGLTRVTTGAVALTALLTTLAIVLVQLIGAGARARVLAVLRTLGASPGQTRALTAWELAPLVATALAVAAVLGLALSALLVRSVDLTGLTGGLVRPELHVVPTVVAAVLGGVLLTVLVAITVSAWLAGRTSLAQQLRVGEES